MVPVLAEFASVAEGWGSKTHQFTGKRSAVEKKLFRTLRRKYIPMDKIYGKAECNNPEDSESVDRVQAAELPEGK